MSHPHHLYRYFDEQGALLYVGISQSAFKRFASHRLGAAWFGAAKNMTIEMFPSRAAVRFAERKAIATENPKFNIAGAKRAPKPKPPTPQKQRQRAPAQCMAFTEKRVTALTKPGVVSDTNTRGLAVRITKAGTKTYIYRRKIRGEVIFHRIDFVGAIRLTTARKVVAGLNGKAARGVDLRAERAQLRAA